MELLIANMHYNGNAYGIEVHADTLTLTIGFVAILTFAIFTCRHFRLIYLYYSTMAATICRLISKQLC